MAFPWGPDSMGFGQSPPRGLTPTTVMTDSPRPLVSTERDAATGAIAVCWDSDRTGVLARVSSRECSSLVTKSPVPTLGLPPLRHFKRSSTMPVLATPLSPQLLRRTQLSPVEPNGSAENRSGSGNGSDVNGEPSPPSTKPPTRFACRPLCTHEPPCRLNPPA